MRVVFYFRMEEVRWSMGDPELEALRTRFPGVEFVSVEDDDDFPTAIATADVFYGFHFPPQQFAAARQLRWIHSATAGVEANLFPALVASAVTLTNAAGVHDVGIPEHCLAMMFAFARNLPIARRLQQAREWNRFTVMTGGTGIRTLAGAKLAVLGAGAIGTGLTRLAAGLGMEVRVLRRRPDGPAVPGATAVVGEDLLHETLGWADFVVLALPLTTATRGIIDAAALEAMRASTYLINVGRGELVDDAALIDALQSGGLAGAGLDVVSTEPLPATSPYWDLDNVILTPHVSAYRSDFFSHMLAVFTANLERWVAGQPLTNVVDKRLGYVVRHGPT